MKKIFLITAFSFFLFLASSLQANFFNTPIAEPNTASSNDNNLKPDYKWSTSSYVGYAWSRLAGVVNPNPELFNQAGAGDSEDGPLGNVPYAGFSLGRRVCSWCIINFSYDVYGALGYRRYHANGILPTQQAGHEILGTSYVRSFLLDHQIALFNLYLDVPNQYGLEIKGMYIKPAAGVGVGVGINKVRGFQAVGYSSAAPYSQNTTLGSTNTNKNLAWDASVGLILCPRNSAVSFGVGYRYCHGGEFVSSAAYVLNDNYNQGAVVSLAPWTGSVKTQELKMFINAEF